jgi:hypothetical protein
VFSKKPGAAARNQVAVILASQPSFTPANDEGRNLGSLGYQGNLPKFLCRLSFF